MSTIRSFRRRLIPSWTSGMGAGATRNRATTLAASSKSASLPCAQLSKSTPSTLPFIRTLTRPITPKMAPNISWNISPGHSQRQRWLGIFWLGQSERTLVTNFSIEKHKLELGAGELIKKSNKFCFFEIFHSIFQGGGKFPTKINRCMS